MTAREERNDRRDNGGRVFGLAVLGVLFGIVILIAALAFFGSPADGDPTGSIELGGLFEPASPVSQTFHAFSVPLNPRA